MRQLNKIQNTIFLVGSLLMVIGAGANLLQWPVAPYLYALGALGFTSMQMLQRYEGQNFAIRRLRRIMLLSDVLFLVSQPSFSSIPRTESVMNWKKRQKNPKSLRNCFKLRKFIFLPQYNVVHLQRQAIIIL